MKNHDIVPVELISSIAALKHGGAFKCLSELLRNKLIKHDRKKYDGYTLNYLGYDYLALNALRHRNVIKGVGRQIGVGKESDVFIAVDEAESKQASWRALCVSILRTGFFPLSAFLEISFDFMAVDATGSRQILLHTFSFGF